MKKLMFVAVAAIFATSFTSCCVSPNPNDVIEEEQAEICIDSTESPVEFVDVSK